MTKDEIDKAALHLLTWAGDAQGLLSFGDIEDELRRLHPDVTELDTQLVAKAILEIANQLIQEEIGQTVH